MTSALRIEICNYLNSAFLNGPLPEFKEEIELLSKLNVDGIITTNWDPLLDNLFPDYRIFVGQSELLFSNPQSIGEIYKIHGSATRPDSLVLTDADYSGFDAANPYLAAKLITIFVEHPVLFIGYSLTDRNVTSLLKAIAQVLGADKLDKLQNNLIFVQRAGGGEPGYSKTFITIDGGQLPITIVTTDTFVPVYEALETVKRKIPARILRYCKEQLYEMARNTTLSDKFCVVDIDDIEKKDDIEFVIGVGVANNERAAQIGYQGINALSLFSDLALNKNLYDSGQLLEKSIPDLARGATYLPIFKHLSAIGIRSYPDYLKSGLSFDKQLPLGGVDHYRSKIYSRAFVKLAKNKSAQEIIEGNTPEKAAIFLPFLPKERFELEAVRKFLEAHLDRFDSSSSYSTYFRKAACLYDFYRYGWPIAK